MSIKRIVAMALIVLGIVVLAYSGITFKTPDQPINMGPIHIRTTQSHYISPVAGGVMLAGGIILLLAGTSWRRST